MTSGTDTATQTARPGWQQPGRRQRLRQWFGGQIAAQLALTLGLVLLFALLGSNLVTNMARLGLTPGFAFLTSAANFEIGESLFSYQAGDSYARAILVGLTNTIEVSIFGCVGATIIGVVFGIARLSENPLLSGLVRQYVGLVRNTPLLLQLFFWSTLLHALPGSRQALQPLPCVFLTNRGLFVPGIAGPWWGLLLAVALPLIGLVVLRSRGPVSPNWQWLLVTAALVAPVVVWTLFEDALSLDAPVLRGFNFAGGHSVSPEFVALTFGLMVNASAGIAETVRAGILSVRAGQWEAARALGLTTGQIMRLIVLPQALKVIVPVTTSSYLSLTKNSSLAVAIGFPDLVSILNTTANVTGQALDAILIMMAAYLALSLVVSAGMNRYNRRLAAQEQR